jgi:16S rRNA (cytosine967-C5)-methyltransferase
VTETGRDREIVLDMLLEVIEDKKFSHTVLNQVLKKHQEMDKQQRAFISRLFTGTVERYLTLDYYINSFASLKVEKMKPLIRNLLRLSVYQILYMDQIPESAVCNEAVKLAKKRGFSKLSGFVNAILRNIIRNRETLALPDKDTNPALYLEAAYSFPSWLAKHLLAQYDYQQLEAMLASSLREKETSIRCNLLRSNPKELRQLLEAEGVRVKDSEYLDYAFRISSYDHLERLDSFRRGLFTVQDVSSMLVCEAAGLKNTDFVVDVCSAPGGKALHAAQIAAKVSARDLTEYKAGLIRENMTRLGAGNVEVKVWDATVTDPSLIGKADVVLADLPCSGLGVIGKKADIKYRLTPAGLKELEELQMSILSVVKDYVKPGGILIYSTCTVNRDENQKIRNWFLEHFDFQAESLDPYLPESLKNKDTKEGYLQLLQGIHGTDGFFLTRLRRR